MALKMDENTFLDFYKNTVLGLSNKQQKQICNMLEKKGKITFKSQRSFEDPEDILYIGSRSNIKQIIETTTTNKSFMNFYEEWEYIKLYKYSVPFFFEGDIAERIKNVSAGVIRNFSLEQESST